MDAAIQVGYDLSNRESLLDADAMAMLQPFSTALTNPASTLTDVPATDFSNEELVAFWDKYEQIPIVNPTKWKFHETVYEEHYYQMLRLLSYELEKPNAVLITFGFSFADENILNLVMRSLSNPGLQVFVCCYSQAGHAEMEDKFKGNRNVKCLMLQSGVMDFTAFNEQVLAWPGATALAPATPIPPAAIPVTDADLEPLI
ncbi:hypothetical protein [Pseudomonas syringae]|uniref:hypothetical protein n=1 Tax=Pseudomonas syringae TaxID=317 RepID=UPI0018D4F303|nr:hypothetical protein [Pseudomonas syringae]